MLKKLCLSQGHMGGSLPVSVPGIDDELLDFEADPDMEMG